MARIPIYQIVYNQLKKDIQESKYPRNSQLPTENQLCKQFDVSKITVRKAISMLADEKYIKVLQGSGSTVIYNNKLADYKRFKDISEVTEEFVKHDNNNSFAIKGIHVNSISATHEIAEALEVSEKTNVYRVQRLVCLNDIPFSIMVNYIREDFAPNLIVHESEITDLYGFLKNIYGLYYKNSKESIMATSADLLDASLLEVPVGTPLLYSERVAQCDKGPLEYAITKFRTDIYRLKVIMQNSLPPTSFENLLNK